MIMYQHAGVDVSLGSQASRIMYEAARQTWDNRKGRWGEIIVPYDDFSGLRAIDVSMLPSGTLMNLGFDGVGTKIEIAERVDDHRTIAYDLFAMVCDDAVIRGAEPVLIGSILDVNRLSAGGEALFRVQQLAEGYVGAAKAAGVAVVNGEIAEMGYRVGGFGDFCYNWGAAVVWFARRERLITGHAVQPGDTIVGLQEQGFRSNGLSLARKAWTLHYGEDWHREEWKGQNLGRAMLCPSQIYSPVILAMTGGLEAEPVVRIHAAAHITGGGLPEKLGRALRPSRCGAVLDSILEPPELMLHGQAVAGISDDEAYRAWHMGQGMVVITPEPLRVIEVAHSFGVHAQNMGTVVSEPYIRMHSRGFYQEGWLSYPMVEP